MANRIGEQFGNYRLVQFLGKGGFAEVYLAQHVHIETHQVAIKVLAAELTDKEIEQFRSEAKTLIDLEHPNIVRVLDFGFFDGNNPYIVMSYAPNGSLRTHHPSESQLPLQTVLAYVKPIASALYYAHGRKLIHRDIKPDNILLGKNLEVLLSDFGLATVARQSSSRSAREIAGTAIYMAPEQFKGKEGFASDQYSLGIMVYEWLCGVPPYQEGNFIQLGYQHTYTPLPSLRSFAPSISPVVEQIVLKALAKVPGERFANVEEFAQNLEYAYKTGKTLTASLSRSPLPQPGYETLQSVSLSPYPQSYPSSQPYQQVYNDQLPQPYAKPYTPSSGSEQVNSTPSVKAEPPVKTKPHYSSPVQGRSLKKDALLIGGYDLLFALLTIPAFLPNPKNASVFINVWEIVFVLITLPVGALLAGSRLGKLRGTLAILIYLPILAALYYFENASVLTTSLAHPKLFGWLGWLLSLPLAALLTGFVYQGGRTRRGCQPMLLGSLMYAMGISISTFSSTNNTSNFNMVISIIAILLILPCIPALVASILERIAQAITAGSQTR